MTQPPLVISIQSQVVYGHVGNSAAVFPMLAAGLEVAAVPTVIFSNTPCYPTLRGRALPPDLFADLLLGLRERGLPGRAEFLLTGYMGSVEVAEMTADFVAEARTVNPSLTYLCDPVLGDAGPGLYVPRPVAEVIRDRLMPLADIATPNPFELGWLSGRDIATIGDLVEARARLPLSGGGRLIVTGCILDDTPEGQIESVHLGANGIRRHPVPRLAGALSGTGDLFAGLIVAGLGRGMTLDDAIDTAQRLTASALRRANDLGAPEVVLSGSDFRQGLLAMDRTDRD